MLKEEEVQDPSGRYTRRGLIGSGAYKAVYKAYDEEEGLEVAWNQIRSENFKDPEQRAKVHSEISILEQLHHQNIINIFDAFETKDKSYIVFVTEIMTSGTLREFIASAGKIRLKIVKNWCKQILRGLAYLHSHNPPVVHRDLKCDNIFMNGNRGEVKIGDLGLSIVLKGKTHAVSVIGTPEFMAPEIYDEKYTSKVDTYSFGMCVLEMVTGKTPYSECENSAQIFRRVTHKQKPQGLDLIEFEDVREFILMCIEFDPEKRPTAQEVLESPFLQSDDNDKRAFVMPEVLLPSPHSQNIDLPTISQQETSKSTQENKDDTSEEVATGTSPRFTSDATFNLADDDEGGKRVYVIDPNIDENTTEIKMKLSLDGDGVCREVEFTFNLEQDTASQVAGEMVSEIGLTQEDADDIAKMIDEKLQGIKAGYMVDESMDIDIEDEEEEENDPQSPADKLSISVFFPHHDAQSEEEEESTEDEGLEEEKAEGNTSDDSSAKTVQSFHSGNNNMIPIEEEEFHFAVNGNNHDNRGVQSAPTSKPASPGTSPKQPSIDDGPSSAPADKSLGIFPFVRIADPDNTRESQEGDDSTTQDQEFVHSHDDDRQQNTLPSPQLSSSPDVTEPMSNNKFNHLDKRFDSLDITEKRRYLAMLARQEEERSQLEERHSGETERFFQGVKHRGSQTSPTKPSPPEDSESKNSKNKSEESEPKSTFLNEEHYSIKNLTADKLFDIRSRSSSAGSKKTDDGIPNSLRSLDQSLHPGSAGSSSSGGSTQSQTLSAMMDQQFSEFEKNNLSSASNSSTNLEGSHAVSQPRPITSSGQPQYDPSPRSWSPEPGSISNSVSPSYSNQYHFARGKTT
eukprot:gb/GECH01013177.1/.p1 GENE.gb/GECH01013177.1/~~gb/GECH01013177.1/.p1  ORF type:complete len:851 (+),score=233.65 gb/GECH01013177.1/:1-2553(+)